MSRNGDFGSGDVATKRCSELMHFLIDGYQMEQVEERYNISARDCPFCKGLLVIYSIEY